MRIKENIIRKGIFIFSLLLIALFFPHIGFAYNKSWDQGHLECVEEPGTGNWGKFDSAGVFHGGYTSKECCELLCKVCPVYAKTGQLQKTFTDLSVPGVGPGLTILRTYNSQDWTSSLLGYGWTFNLGRRLIIGRNKDNEKIIGILLETGEKNFYKEHDDGSLERLTDYGATYNLIKNADNTYMIQNFDGSRYELQEDGKIANIIDRNGKKLVFQYNSVGCLSKITNASGNYMDFQLGPNGKIASISDNFERTIKYEFDENGNLTSFTDPLGNTTQYVYNSNNMLTQVIDARGNTTETVTYDNNDPPRVSTFTEKGEIHTISYLSDRTEKTDSAGNTWAYYFNNVGIIEKVVDPFGNEKTQQHNKVTSTSLDWEDDLNGNRTTFTWDTNGNMTSKVDPVGNTTTYTYIAGTNWLETEKDPLGRITKYEYDANGNETKIIQDYGGPLQNETKYTYDSNGNQLSMSDPLGNITSYTYDENGHIIKIMDPLGNVTKYTYDNRGSKLTETDANNDATTYAYDLMNRLTLVTDALGHTTTYIYDANGNKTSETDANGNARTFTYDAYNRLIQGTDPFGNTIYYAYDSRDNRTSLTDANGNINTYAYDILNHLTSEINALGGQTNYTYDAVGNILTVTDANGNTTTFTYDANRRKVSETNAAGETTAYSYDADGNQIAQTLPNSNTITMTYDSLNRLVQISDSLGLIKTFKYDLASRRISESNALGNIIHRLYDTLGRLIQLTDSLGNTISFSYNAIGNLLSITDREGNIINQSFDVIGRRISLTDQLGNTTVFSHDNVGNLLSVTDANGNITRYSYDKLNRLIQETYADGSIRSFTYDANGNMLTRKNQKGNVTTYSYDALNRRVGIDYPDSNDSVYVYDALGNLRDANNQNATISFDYDNAYRLTQSVQNGQTVSYAYDMANNTRTITYPSSKVIKEVRNPRRLLLRVENDSAQAIVQYTYDSVDRVQTKSYLNGIAAKYSYNVNGWVTDLNYDKSGTQTIGFQYDFDNEGNRLYAYKFHDPSNSEQYIYDAKYRLTQFKRGTLDGNGVIQVPITQTAYNLDALGNWPSKITDGVTESRTHNNMNEITKVDGVSYLYDDNGNLINDGTNTYEYDYENRLVKVTEKLGGIILGMYKYDSLGRRIEKQAAGDTISYYYDENRVIEEHVGSVTEATYIYGNNIDEVISMEQASQTYYYLINSLGSIVTLTDVSGNIIEQYDYDAYGKPNIFESAGNSLSSSVIGNHYLFTGRCFDQESDLQYNRNRYLAYKLGRWITRDPLEYKDSFNLYIYVNNDPINWTDPLGQQRDRRGGGDFESDWAGRAILWRYLTGGGDWNIQNDSRWTAYMEANYLLKIYMKAELVQLLRNMCNKQTGYTYTFNITKPVEIENGEGIIGYQYLHGTNSDVGDFQIKGTAVRGPGGPDPRCCIVNFNVHYQWNDIIDPNPQYTTDDIKSIFAETITLGNAEAYTIRIGWDAESSYRNGGGQITLSGWPLSDP